MSTPSRPNNPLLPLDAQQRIAETCARFDQVWRAGSRPRLENVLYPAGRADEHRELLRALLEIEFFYRRQAPGGFSLDEYLARFSEQADLVREVFAAQTVATATPRLTPSASPTPVGPDEVGAVAAGPPAFLGRYRVTGTLGRGTFGVVYRGRDDRLHRDVAIKVPRPELVERLGGVEAYLKEARVVAALEHPNIVLVHDVDHTSEGLCYVVFGLVEGNDLCSRLEQGPAFSPAEAARLVAALAGALQHAHQKGVYHRDLKPANILLDRSDKPYLTDFGLAQQQEDYGKGPRFAGTLAYVSPEQSRRGSHRVDGRSDVFSLGAVLYELLTGQRPFQGSAEQILDRIANGEARPLRELAPAVPAELERICLKAMARPLSDRYTAAAALAADLQAWLDGDGAPPPMGGMPPQASSPFDLALTRLIYFTIFVVIAAASWFFGKEVARTLQPPPFQTPRLPDSRGPFPVKGSAADSP